MWLVGRDKPLENPTLPTASQGLFLFQVFSSSSHRHQERMAVSR